MRRSIFQIASLAILFALLSTACADRARAQDICPTDKDQEEAADRIPGVKKYISEMEAGAAETQEQITKVQTELDKAEREFDALGEKTDPEKNPAIVDLKLKYGSNFYKSDEYKALIGPVKELDKKIARLKDRKLALATDLRRFKKTIESEKLWLDRLTILAGGKPRCSKIRRAKKTTQTKKPFGQHRPKAEEPVPDLGPVFPEQQALEAKDGLYLGLELSKNTGDQEIIETLDATGAVTNRLQDRNDPVGFGVVAGYNFVPWHNRVFVGPFASLDYLRQTINRNFAGGTFIGSTTNWVGNLGVKSGVALQSGMSVYGLAGLGLLNEDLNINFGGPVTSSNKTIPGFMLGVGGEWQPGILQRWGRPVSLFVQYQHTWWADAKLSTPISSPLFNYNFRREDDTIRFGVNFYLNDAPVSQSPSSSRGRVTK